MRRAASCLLALAAALPACAGGPDARVLEHRGRWESGYGETFYNVVGRVENTSGHALAWVKLRVEALDGEGRVVATTETYNESAEALTVADLSAADRDRVRQKLKPVPAHGEERFRASFLRDETPPFTDYRVTVVETPAAP